MAWLAPRRLSTRIVGLFLGLLLLVQGAGFLAIRAGIERNARATLAGELEVGERIWTRLLEQKAQALVQGATLLAADYGFRSAVASGDVETLASALENHGARIGARMSAWVDNNAAVLAFHGDAGQAQSQQPLLKRVAAELVASPRNTALVMLGQRPYQFVAVPMRAPVVIGWVVMGFPIDQGVVDDMKDLSGLQVAIVANTPAGLDVIVSTLPGSSHLELAAAGSGSATLGGEAMITRRVPLGHNEKAAGVLLLRSVDEAVARYAQLQVWLAAITLMGLAVFAAGSHFTARRVTTPLRSLVSAADRLGRGEYGTPMDNTARLDEIGDLAKAFDHMRVNIAAHAAEVRQLAYHDRLTGLPNRVLFREEVERAIQAGAPFAVLMLDLDRFKHVNDVLGYAFGDRLLRVVAQRLLGQAVRQGDLVARFSGDEFALLLPAADMATAAAVAERIAEVFETPLVLEDQTVDLSAGFGIACWPLHGNQRPQAPALPSPPPEGIESPGKAGSTQDAETMINRAEVAMYAAKRKTTQVVVYDPSIDSDSAQTLSLLSELRRALERDELVLFLQPKIAFADARLIGAEALVRWQHPTRGLVPPMQFIPFAEQTGFVRQLTLWIFEEVVRQWPMMRALGLQRVSVNLSTRDLLDPDLLGKLQAILARHGVPASAFCLEITESAIMDEPLRAEAMLGALSSAGFKLSIDDFGTGYSSLAYLKRLPVDELKIDKSFVMAMERDADDAKIVRSTIDLAHNLGLSVVAEGVENAAVWRQLQLLECDEGQGFHMSKPLPAADLPDFARRWALRSESPAVALH